MELRIILSELPSFLPDVDVLNVAITCKSFFSSTSYYINSEVLFRYPGEGKKFKWYNPNRMKMGGLFGGRPSHPTSFDPHFSFSFDDLPSSLTHLTFGKHFNQPVDNLLPLSLRYLSFGEQFNQRVDSLPPTLTNLSFGFYFNQPIDSLPSTLTHLNFDCFYSQDSSTLPSSILKLKLSNIKCDILPNNLASLDVRRFIPCTLPPSITKLKIRYSATLIFPPHLKRLSFSPVSHDQLNSLPSSLESLSFSFPGHTSGVHRSSLPPNLSSLSAKNCPILSFPPSLTTLKMKLSTSTDKIYAYTRVISLNNSLFLEALSVMKNLTHLTLALYAINTITLNLKCFPLLFLKIMQVKTSILTLPDTLKCLHVEELECDFLPPFLEDLRASCNFKEFPSSLLRLFLANKHHSSSLSLPPSLTELSLLAPLPAVLFPSSLKKLILNCRNIPPLLSLPPLLSQLVVGISNDLHSSSIKSNDIYNHPLPLLPPSLTSLTLLFQLQETTLVSLPPFLKHLEVFTSFPLPPIPLTLESMRLNNLDMSSNNEHFFSKFNGIIQ